MWEKKEDPLWKNYEISVWALTIITILFVWVMVLIDIRRNILMSTLGGLLIGSIAFGPFIFRVYTFVLGLGYLLYEWIRKKTK